MLGRAKRLQETFQAYCTTHGYIHFQLDKEEWRQIDYLLCITEPFFKFTTALSKSKDITIHLIFGVYNKLFNHLENSEAQLLRKRLPWKKSMLRALQAAREKLSEYYTATDHEFYGDVYGIATILAPSKKLRFFNSEDWKGNINNGARYRDCLEKEFWRYKRRVSDQAKQSSSTTQEDLHSTIDEIEMLCDSQTSLQPGGVLTEEEDDELARYIAKGKSGVLYRSVCLQLLIFLRSCRPTSPSLLENTSTRVSDPRCIYTGYSFDPCKRCRC
jgi:hypothetical protein